MMPTTTTMMPTTTTMMPTTTTMMPTTTTMMPTTTQQLAPFKNIEGFTSSKREHFENMTKENNDVEKMAIGFVSVIILLFLVIMFMYIRNYKK